MREPFSSRRCRSRQGPTARCRHGTRLPMQAILVLHHAENPELQGDQVAELVTVVFALLGGLWQPVRGRRRVLGLYRAGHAPATGRTRHARRPGGTAAITGTRKSRGRDLIDVQRACSSTLNRLRAAVERNVAHPVEKAPCGDKASTTASSSTRCRSCRNDAHGRPLVRLNAPPATRPGVLRGPRRARTAKARTAKALIDGPVGHRRRRRGRQSRRADRPPGQWSCTTR
jgi:hypothetical protein